MSKTSDALRKLIQTFKNIAYKYNRNRKLP